MSKCCLWRVANFNELTAAVTAVTPETGKLNYRKEMHVAIYQQKLFEFNFISVNCFSSTYNG
jgi:hypothetical protein